jgi:DNA-binding response OmpR family regulator
LLGRRRRERKIKRILVVEDEPLVAFDNEHLLGESGYEVVATVDNVDEAERVIASEPLDLVMTDLALRGDRDGRDVARAAMAKGVPVLFVTGRGEIEPDGLAVACLSKPYSDRTLQVTLEAIDDMLQGLKTRRLPAGLRLFRPEPA